MSTHTPEQQIQQQFQERMNYDELLNCMRCGFCLPSCPTYIQTGFNEVHSPRGRIALMKAVTDGVIPMDDDIENSLNVCLGCRACEPVCPSGVQYGHLLEEARDIIQQNKKQSIPVSAVRKTIFHELFPHQNRMKTAIGLVGLYQRTGVQKIVRKIGFMNLFPKSLKSMEKVLPSLPTGKQLKNRPTTLPALSERTSKVAFLSGCLMDTMFLKTNDHTMKLLQLAGCDVVIPTTQGCCGALHGHSGEKDKAKELAKRNIAAFEKTEADFYISNAGGCGAFIQEYDHLLKDEPEWHARAQEFVSKLKDISQILVELKFHEKYKLQVKSQIVTYQDSCHLKNVMKSSAAPRELLHSIKGVDFREMRDPDHCCGSAGIYNVVEYESSMKILDYKMVRAKEVVPDVIVTSNPGCHMQMMLGIERENLKTRALHIVDLLAEAVSIERY